MDNVEFVIPRLMFKKRGVGVWVIWVAGFDSNGDFFGVHIIRLLISSYIA